MKENIKSILGEKSERIKKLFEENGRIAKLAKEAYKNVTLGKGNAEGLFILGFIAGYKKKENENN